MLIRAEPSFSHGFHGIQPSASENSACGMTTRHHYQHHFRLTCPFPLTTILLPLTPSLKRRKDTWTAGAPLRPHFLFLSCSTCTGGSRKVRPPFSLFILICSVADMTWQEGQPLPIPFRGERRLVDAAGRQHVKQASHPISTQHREG